MSRTMTLAGSVRLREWERVALLLLVGIELAARTAPPGTIDDVLALLSEDADDAPR